MQSARASRVRWAGRVPDPDTEVEERGVKDDLRVVREERRGVGEGGEGEAYVYTMRFCSALESLEEVKQGLVVRVSQSLL